MLFCGVCMFVFGACEYITFACMYGGVLQARSIMCVGQSAIIVANSDK